MALPSQSGSGAGRRSMMSSRRRRRRGGPVLLFLLVVAAAAATWWIWPQPREGELTMSAEAPSASSEQPITAQAPPPKAAPKQVEFEPPTQVASSPQAVVASPEVLPAVASSPASDTAGDAATPSPASPPPTAAEKTSSIEPLLADAATLIRGGDVVEARRMLSAALRQRTLSGDDAAEIRGVLEVLNEGMVFGPEVTPGDPYVRLYEIRPGDALSKIASREGTKTHWRLIQRINGITNPSRIGAGQRVKLIQGPFHVEVDKGDYRLDVWLGEGDEAVFVKSLPVGLGEFNSTPHGTFRVRRGGKMANPSWTNPRTGERFGADDPLNPIGEYWIGLDGIDANNLQERGFGIHGTIEPDSIGRDESMGCVRLGDADIALVYELLTEGNSIVLVREQ
ncbi:MAG: L,D-transpeptidase family protein [Phycisphaerales bacterium]|nr:L,D-transpeptidase family protein [Phycisphaerales bacterium]